MSSVQRKREKRNARSKAKRAFLRARGTRTKARARVAFAVGPLRVVLRRIVAGTMARVALTAGVTKPLITSAAWSW